MFVQRQGALEGTLEAFEGVDANRSGRSPDDVALCGNWMMWMSRLCGNWMMKLGCPMPFLRTVTQSLDPQDHSVVPDSFDVRVKDSACKSAMSVVVLISHGCGPCGPLAPLTGTVRSGAPGAS